MSTIHDVEGVIKFIRFAEQDVRDDVCELMTISPENKASMLVDERDAGKSGAPTGSFKQRLSMIQGTPVNEGNSASGASAGAESGSGASSGSGDGGQSAGGARQSQPQAQQGASGAAKRASAAPGAAGKAQAKKPVLIQFQADDERLTQVNTDLFGKTEVDTSSSSSGSSSSGNGDTDDDGKGPRSQLSQQIAKSSLGAGIPKFFEKPVIRDGERTHNLKVFLDFAKPAFVKIEVPSQTLVAQAIGLAVVEAINNKVAGMICHVDAYIMRLAEEDGEVDAEFPLDKKRPLLKFGSSCFALCENPNPPKQVVAMKAEAMRRSGQKPKVKEHLMKIFLPGNATTRLSVREDMTVGELRAVVCKKIDLKPEDCVFQMMDFPQPLVLTRTVKSYDEDELQLVITNQKVANMLEEERLKRAEMETGGAGARGRAGSVQSKLAKGLGLRKGSSSNSEGGSSSSSTDVDDSPEILLFSEFTASQYKEYEVWKTNNRGRRQLRIMGIDRERIYNMLPSKGSSFLSRNSKRVRKGTHEIDDVLEVYHEDGKAKFEIEYFEESEKRMYYYEAQSPAMAQEIVGKVRFLVQLRA